MEIITFIKIKDRNYLSRKIKVQIKIFNVNILNFLSLSMFFVHFYLYKPDTNLVSALSVKNVLWLFLQFL